MVYFLFHLTDCEALPYFYASGPSFAIRNLSGEEKGRAEYKAKNTERGEGTRAVVWNTEVGRGENDGGGKAGLRRCVVSAGGRRDLWVDFRRQEIKKWGAKEDPRTRKGVRVGF